MAYHFKHSQSISAKGVENCNKAANALALSAESFSVSDSSLASGQITFLLFPSFFFTMIKATNPTGHSHSLHILISSSLLSDTENSLKARQSTLSHKSHSHTLFETHITVHYHQQSPPQTRKSNNQTTTSPSTWTPHQQVATYTSIYHGQNIPTLTTSSLHSHSYSNSQTKRKEDGREKGAWKRIWVSAEAWKPKPNYKSEIHYSKPTQVSRSVQEPR